MVMALQCMSNDRLARCAWVADIELMLDGCRDCWTYKLLHTMSLLGVVDGSTIWDLAGRPECDEQRLVIHDAAAAPKKHKGSAAAKHGMHYSLNHVQHHH